MVRSYPCLILHYLNKFKTPMSFYRKTFHQLQQW